MTINDPIKVRERRVPDPEAMCCNFVAGLVPPGCPVQQSNGPTAADAAEVVAPSAHRDVPVAHPDPRAGIHGSAQSGPENAPDAALRRFYDDLHRALPAGFLLDEEITCNLS